MDKALDENAFFNAGVSVFAGRILPAVTSDDKHPCNIHSELAGF
jgi:hypothetical protein